MARKKSADAGRVTGAAYRKAQGLVAVVAYVTAEQRDAMKDAAFFAGRLSLQEWASRTLAESAAAQVKGKDRPQS